MSEELLYQIWKGKALLKHELKTSQGNHIQIIDSGERNLYSGPDFKQACIRFDGIAWYGAVEIHVKASDWYQHKHQIDPAYESVILHVVWEEDIAISLDDGQLIPCLVLSKYIAIPSQYIPTTNSDFACLNYVHTVSEEVKEAMKTKCLDARLQQKADSVTEIWLHCEKDWEETIYRVLARSMGFQQNADAMYRLACSIPLKLLWKYRESPLRMEALLFGQAGLLDEFPNIDLILDLKIEYEFLKTKHQLGNVFLHRSHWKYFKLRPQNFPNIRIFELIELLRSNLSLLTLIVEIKDLKNLKLFFESHHLQKRKAFGEQAFKSIVINAIIPILLVYAKEKSEESYAIKANNWLLELKPEGHLIEKKFEKIGLKAKNASDSQACIYWKQNYCDKGKCSICLIGNFVVMKSF